jgi:hypothetical protein
MTLIQQHNLKEDFAAFDSCFPLLAAGMIPSFLFPFIPSIANGIKGRERLFKFIGIWVEDGMPGLDEGLVYDMAQIGHTAGHSSREIASVLNTDLWALQANTPPAAVALLLYILQSPLLSIIHKEIDSISTKSNSTIPDLDMKALASLEMVASCVQETIRLNTSSFSVRIAKESFVLPTSVSPDRKGVPTQGYLIPSGSRIICATRAAHLSDAIWGSNPSVWDGARFVDRADEVGMKNKKAREMKGFGGGISIVGLFRDPVYCLPHFAVRR